MVIGDKSYTIRFGSGATGDYVVKLETNGVTRFLIPLEVRGIDTCAAIVTPVEPLTEAEQHEQDNVIVSFLLIAISMGYVAYHVGKRGSNPVLPSILIGMLGLCIFTYIGMLPSWILFSILLCLFVLVAFKFSDIIKTGGS